MGIKEDLEKVVSYVEKSQMEESKKKEKKFKIPFGKKVSNNQRKKNYVTLILLGDNNGLDFKKVQIEDQTFMEDSIPRLAGAGYIYYYKRNPCIILPSWSVEPLSEPGDKKILKPFSSKEDFEESLKDGRNTVGYRLLMNRMKSAMMDNKKKIGGALKWALGLGLAALIGYALITGGG